VPTWLYGHEPANLFAGGIAKYFSNAIREDMILGLARGGVVFAPGRAGTVQEIFQAATKVFYRTAEFAAPLVLLDAAYWTRTLPVVDQLRGLLTHSPHGDLSSLVHVTDGTSAAIDLLGGG
jgi:predicted Rossmann-fold nucleotide-binding protein